MLSLLKKRKLKKLLNQALEDGVLTDDEGEAIEKMRLELGLPEELIAEVRSNHFHKLINPLIDEICRTRRLSDEHLHTLGKHSKNLRVKTDIPEEFAIFRLLWIAENTGEFNPPAVPAPTNIRLTKGEKCHHITQANWLRVKTRRKTQYVGSSVSLRVAKGVSFRFGGAQPIRHEWEEVVPQDLGSLCVTSKKLVFIGESMKSCTVSMGTLAAWEALQDGIVLHKTRGPSEIFQLPELDIEYTALLLSRLQ